MGASYHQFCPVAKAMELLDERWTLLVVRELINGSQRFNELRRGLPRMSPTLLSKRLQQLARAGLVTKTTHRNEVLYQLSPAGRELQPALEAIGTWGIRWIGELGDADLDPHLLLWDMRRNVDHAAVPAGRTVVQFVFPDVAASARSWWLVITDGDVDVCDADPGYPVGVTVTTSLRCLTEIWLGNRVWSDVLRGGDIVLRGEPALCRAVPRWFTLSVFAAVPRPVRANPAPARA